MKRLKLLMVLLSCSIATFAQIDPPYQIFLSTNGGSPHTGCSGYSVTVSGIANYQYHVSDPGPYDNCNASACNVYLQRWTGSTWTTIQSTSTTISNNNYSFTFNPTSGQHRVYATVKTYGTYCTGSANQSNEYAYYTVNTPASATFKIDGYTVNTSSNLARCDLNNLTMTNIAATGTNSSYQWRVGTRRNSETIMKYSSWFAGMPPSSYDLKSFITSQYVGQPLAAQFDVYLETKNICNSGSPNVYWGKIQVLASEIDIQLQAKNTSTGTPLYDISASTTCAAPHTSWCWLSTIIAANQTSIPLLIGGQWSCKLEEIPVSNCAATPTLVFNKSAASLVNLNDLASLDLNAFAVLYGGKSPSYLTSQFVNKIWKFSLTVSNICNTQTAVCYLRNVNTGCKTSEGSETDATTNTSETSLIIDSDWTFYPNPATNKVTVLWPQDAKAGIKVFDMLGRQVKVAAEVTNGQAVIDVTGLNSGTYVLWLGLPGAKPKVMVVE